MRLNLYRRLVVILCSLALSLSFAPAFGKTGKWEDEWKDTKKEYEKITNKKKPAEKTLGFFRKSSGIEKSLKKLDKAWAEVGKKKTQDSLDDYSKAVDEFVTTKDAYIKLIQKGMDEDTDEDEAYGHALDMLKKDLDGIAETAKGQITWLQASMVEGKGAKDTTIAAGFDALKGAQKRAETFVSKVKAKPVPKTFNDGIKDAARDMTQQLGNISKLKTFKKSDPNSIFKKLDPWANEKIKLKETDDKAAVLKMLGDFEDLVKEVSDWIGEEEK